MRSSYYDGYSYEDSRFASAYRPTYFDDYPRNRYRSNDAGISVQRCCDIGGDNDRGERRCEWKVQMQQAGTYAADTFIKAAATAAITALLIAPDRVSATANATAHSVGNELAVIRAWERLPSAGEMAAVGLQIGALIIVAACCLRRFDAVPGRAAQREHDPNSSATSDMVSAAGDMASQLATLTQAVAELREKNEQLEARLAQRAAPPAPARHSSSSAGVSLKAQAASTRGWGGVRQADDSVGATPPRIQQADDSEGAASPNLRVPVPPNVLRASVDAAIAATFKVFDANHSGFLDFLELRNALKHYGVDCTDIEAASLLRRYDDHPDGKLDLEEFTTLVHDISSSSAKQDGMAALLEPPATTRPGELVPDGRGSFHVALGSRGATVAHVTGSNVDA